MFSIVMATYERAHTLPRAIKSVLAQTFTEWELVIVDDGSSDGTREVIANFSDARIRYVRHPHNRGVTAAKNTGFDHARGPWLSTLDSDDEMVPRALATFAATLERVDPNLDAIACNCLDAETGKMTGKGLEHDGIITLAEVLDHASGEHWSVFHQRILGTQRFDERIRGYERVLWDRIHESARWYYVHQALRVYHRDAGNQLTERSRESTPHDRRMTETYAAILDHAPDYVDRLQRVSPRASRRFAWNAAGQFLLAGDDEHYRVALEHLRQSGARVRPWMLRAAHFGAPIVRPIAARVRSLRG